MKIDPPARALAVGAHPDDIEFGAGGTLARWAAAGCEVTMLVVTDGSKGTWDPTMEPYRLAAVRIDEQREAAHVLGAKRVAHLGYVDGELLYTMDLRAEMCRQVRLIRPDVVLSHDPWKRYELHPDHRATGMAVADGVVAARDHLFFPEQGLTHHRPSHLLLWAADELDHHEDISQTLDTKVAALRCHSTQSTTTMGGAGDDAEADSAFHQMVASQAGDAAVGTSYSLAEAFKRLTP